VSKEVVTAKDKLTTNPVYIMHSFLVQDELESVSKEVVMAKEKLATILCKLHRFLV